MESWGQGETLVPLCVCLCVCMIVWVLVGTHGCECACVTVYTHEQPQVPFALLSKTVSCPEVVYQMRSLQ